MATPSGLPGYSVSIAAGDLTGAWDVAVDLLGGFYVSDVAKCVVMRYAGLGASGVIAAGVVNSCSHGSDGIASTSSALYTPTGLAVYAPTDFIVAEYSAHCVRRSTNGIIRTVAGTGAAANNGDGAAATAAAINSPGLLRIDSSGSGFYISEWGGNQVRYVNGAGVISTVFTGTKLNTIAVPYGRAGM